MTDLRRWMEIVEAAAHPFRQVVASLTTDGTGGDADIRDLRTRVKAMVDGWRGRVIHNTETGYDITISRTSVNKTVAVGELLLRIHYALPSILQHGVFMSSDSPRDNRPGMIEMLNLGASIELDGRLLHVIAKVRRYPQGNQHYSLHYDGDIQIVP